MMYPLHPLAQLLATAAGMIAGLMLGTACASSPKLPYWVRETTLLLCIAAGAGFGLFSQSFLPEPIEIRLGSPYN
jgi:hypothetical protein